MAGPKATSTRAPSGSPASGSTPSATPTSEAPRRRRGRQEEEPCGARPTGPRPLPAGCGGHHVPASVPNRTVSARPAGFHPGSSPPRATPTWPIPPRPRGFWHRPATRDDSRPARPGSRARARAARRRPSPHRFPQEAGAGRAPATRLARVDVGYGRGDERKGVGIMKRVPVVPTVRRERADRASPPTPPGPACP